MERLMSSWGAVLFAALLFVTSVPAAQAQEAPTLGAEYMEALQNAVDEALAGLETSGLERGLNLAVVPIGNDPDHRGYELLRIGLSRTPHKVFERQSGEWDRLLDEIQWGQRREDIMDPATVQRFGAVQGVSAIMYGRILDVERKPAEQGVKAGSAVHDAMITRLRLNVHVSMVGTGEHAWGTSVTAESTLPPRPPEEPFHVTHGRTLLLVGGGLIALIILIAFISKATRPL